MMLPLEPCQNTKENPHPPLSALLNLRIVPKLNAMRNPKLLNFLSLQEQCQLMEECPHPGPNMFKPS